MSQEFIGETTDEKKRKIEIHGPSHVGRGVKELKPSPIMSG